MDKWLQTDNLKPNAEGDNPLAELLRNLTALQTHYEQELSKEQAKVAYLEGEVNRIESQKARRKGDNRG